MNMRGKIMSSRPEPTEFPPVAGVRFAKLRSYPGYAIGTDGSVWSVKYREWRRMKTPPGSFGYPKVTLSVGNKHFDFHTHRLVAMAFLGDPAPGHVVRHLNGDPADCRLENLAYGTFSDNEADKERHGRRPVGERVFGAKLNAVKVVEIRKKKLGGASLGRLATEIGVNKSTIARVCRGETWKHLRQCGKRECTVQGTEAVTWESV